MWSRGTTRHRPLSLRDVVERPDGEVRCRPSLFQELWGQAPAWGRAVAPLAEHLAGRLTAAIPALEGGMPLEATTPLTGRKRRAAQARQRGWREPSTAEPRRPAALPRACGGCGGPVAGSRLRCPACAQQRRYELRAELSLERLGRARGGAKAPVPGGLPAGIRRGLGELAVAMGLPGEPVPSWEAALSHLREVGPVRLTGLTGASRGTVGRWLRGEAVPRRCWWEAIAGRAPTAG